MQVNSNNEINFQVFQFNELCVVECFACLLASFVRDGFGLLCPVPASAKGEKNGSDLRRRPSMQD